MSFASQYQSRFDDIIAPAIRSVTVGGIQLQPLRVDISKSGDSILTEISDSIAHSRVVLADVSTIGRDSVTGRPYRNANVLYEVGLALSCRHSSEVLLLRDDRDDFLFDVSTIPHKTVDFTNTVTAKEAITQELVARINEQKFHLDARVQIAIDSLSAEEVLLFKHTKQYTELSVWGQEVKGISNWWSDAVQRLLDKRIIRLAGEFDEQIPAFQFTPLGGVVQKMVNMGLRKITPDIAPTVELKDEKSESPSVESVTG